MGMTIRTTWSKGQWIPLLILGVMLLTVPATAVADEEPDEEVGVEKLRTANDAFDDGDFETAYEYYVEAYDILEVPLIKYRMGQTADILGMAPEAVAHYEAYREIGEDEEFLERIDDALPSLRRNLPATVELVTEPDEVVITIDGEEIGTTPETFEYPAGDVEIALERDGYESATLEESLAAGETHQLEATLDASDGPAPMADVDDPGPQPDVDPDDGPSLGLWGWTSTGLGASILALGGVMSFFQADTTAQVNEFDRRQQAQQTDSQQDWDELRERQQGLRDDAQNYYQAATGAYIAGGILTATGLGILAYDAFSGDEAPAEGEGLSFDVGFGPSGGFIGIDGRF